jgi:Holliday junction resolvase-like predicted endonuclease
MSDGRDAERELAGYYENAGFECYQPPKARYRQQDVFGEFDLIAFGAGRLEFVQCKAGRDAAGITDWFKRTEAYEQAIRDASRLFAHRKGEHWRLARPTGAGYQWVYDGRKHTEIFDQDITQALRRVQ